MDSKEKTARSIYQAYNDGAFDQAVAAISSDFELISIPTGQTFRGAQGQTEFLQAWRAAFPNSRVTIDSVTIEGNEVIVRFVGQGTHTGPLVSPQGTIPPTNRRLTLHVTDIHEFNDEGLIARTRQDFDIQDMMAQLGIEM